MADEQLSPLEQAKESLERMQQYDTARLPRRDELGTELCFDGAVEPANKLIALYKKLSISALEDFPEAKLKEITNQANADYASFERITSYSATQGVAERDNLIKQLVDRYPNLFDKLHPLISYSMHKQTDFEELDMQARAAMQKIEDQSNKLMEDLEKKREAAASTLEKIKIVAAEQGVTQQAIHFKNEAERHEMGAKKWFAFTCWSAGILFLYTILAVLGALFMEAPSELYANAQLTISKVLIFGVLSFALYFSAKNYFSEKHNEVINKHRQNALVTYRAIVNAAGNTANTDIILNHAASCIFAPQSTGFSGVKSASSLPSSSPMNILLKQASDG